MTKLRTMEERFANDPQFRAIVACLENLFCELQMTPSEVREAAMFAQIRFEMQRPRQMVFSKDLLQQLERERGRIP